MITLHLSNQFLHQLRIFFFRLCNPSVLAAMAYVIAMIATLIMFVNGKIVAYGDAESHLNIAKRVIDSITPGLAQLGGIWLPLPHILMIPFIYFDPLWRSGLAGSFVSNLGFVLGAYYLYKLTYYVTKSKPASFIAYLIFILNPNILYMQTTPMTETLLIGFFIASTYYYVVYLHNQSIIDLVYAAFFTFCATISRYDGWFLVLFQSILLVAYGIFHKRKWSFTEGRLILYAVVAFLGIFGWLLWGFLILGDPLYFTHSEFSAKSQQAAWLARGELPTYNNLPLSFAYYLIDSVSNTGIIVSALAFLGGLYYLLTGDHKYRLSTAIILSVPFIFNVYTLYAGQSVIFLPHVTPSDYEWHLFNVRYGMMMIPAAAFLAGWLFYCSHNKAKLGIVLLFIIQMGLFMSGYSQVITYADGVNGLSANKPTSVQNWFSSHYDGGLVLMDDFARSFSIVKSPVPMDKTIYIGNKPYWQESLVEPQKYARWIIIQKNDSLWKNIYEKKEVQARLYKYFNKVYTSPDILVFRRIKT